MENTYNESQIPNSPEKQTGAKRLIMEIWLVLLLAAFFGISLAFISINLGPMIEENILNETLERIPSLILGSENAEKGTALDINPFTLGVGDSSNGKVYKVFGVSRQDIPEGFVIKAEGQGYADKIGLILGLDSKVQKITGVYILDQKETPGLGNKIAEDEWLKQFKGRDAADDFVAVKGGADGTNEVDAVTGATISSESVCNILNTAIKDLQPRLINYDKEITGVDE